MNVVQLHLLGLHFPMEFSYVTIARVFIGEWVLKFHLLGQLKWIHGLRNNWRWWCWEAIRLWDNFLNLMALLTIIKTNIKPRLLTIIEKRYIIIKNKDEGIGQWNWYAHGTRYLDRIIWGDSTKNSILGSPNIIR